MSPSSAQRGRSSRSARRASVIEPVGFRFRATVSVLIACVCESAKQGDRIAPLQSRPFFFPSARDTDRIFPRRSVTSHSTKPSSSAFSFRASSPSVDTATLTFASRDRNTRSCHFNHRLRWWRLNSTTKPPPAAAKDKDTHVDEEGAIYLLVGVCPVFLLFLSHTTRRRATHTAGPDSTKEVTRDNAADDGGADEGVRGGVPRRVVVGWSSGDGGGAGACEHHRGAHRLPGRFRDAVLPGRALLPRVPPDGRDARAGLRGGPRRTRRGGPGGHGAEARDRPPLGLATRRLYRDVVVDPLRRRSHGVGPHGPRTTGRGRLRRPHHVDGAPRRRSVVELGPQRRGDRRRQGPPSKGDDASIRSSSEW
mmetsp:Transcript_4556/g.15168  ORF Transcript_4556/g.15168 Transcript_4556/m.15168 type:complete len:365 (-) Transcript_4556:3863-4957(-)